MMGQEQVEAFRNMTPSERWKLQVRLMDSAWEEMLKLDATELSRRLDYLNRQHEIGNQRIIDRFRSLRHGAPAPADRP